MEILGDADQPGDLAAPSAERQLVGDTPTRAARRVELELEALRMGSPVRSTSSSWAR
jgi:hypothetical protein